MGPWYIMVYIGNLWYVLLYILVYYATYGSISWYIMASIVVCYGVSMGPYRGLGLGVASFRSCLRV